MKGKEEDDIMKKKRKGKINRGRKRVRQQGEGKARM